ncbi:MAG: FAD-binding oxidoreductase [Mycobacteriales bacterium]
MATEDTPAARVGLAAGLPAGLAAGPPAGLPAGLPAGHPARLLEPIVGARHLAAEVALTDWTGRFRGAAAAVVHPANTEEVAAVLAACSAARIPVVPAGGNTGLVAGATPPAALGAVVLRTDRLTGCGPVDRAARQLSAGAGVTLAEVARAAADAGLRYGVDLSARDSATVGGTVATNAGGMRVVADGPTRAQLLGVTAVLADGTVIDHLGGLGKEVTGYDLGQLLVGSEGTLAVLTAVRLRLLPAVRGEWLTALVPVAGMAGAVALLSRLSAPRAVEYLEEEDGRTWVLVEVPAEADLPQDALVGDRRLWSRREAVAELAGRGGPEHPPHKLDVTLPVAALATFRADLDQLVAPHTLVLWGHLAEGNLHVNVVGPPPDDDRIDDAVLRLAAAHGGAVSSEHGIGRAKTRWLALSRTAAEIAVMRRIKEALDPLGILNPGVLFPPTPAP